MSPAGRSRLTFELAHGPGGDGKRERLAEKVPGLHPHCPDLSHPYGGSLYPGKASADDADLDRINLALALYDQQQVYVPHTGEATPAAPLPSGAQPPTSAGSEDATATGGKVNLNTATVQQLDTLPGIGPAIAQRIIDYRKAHGPFTAPEDITNVKGIGQATYEKLQDLITAP